jgi:hypothetical protein
MSSSEMEAVLRVQSDLFSLMYRYTTNAVHGVFYEMYSRLSEMHDNDEDVCSHLQWSILRTHMWSAKNVASVATPWSRISKDCVILARKLGKCSAKIMSMSGLSQDDENVEIRVTFPEILHAILTSASRVVSNNLPCVMTADTSQLANLMRYHHIVEDAMANVYRDHMVESSPESDKMRTISKRLESDYKRRAEELERRQKQRMDEEEREREERRERDRAEREATAKMRQKMEAEFRQRLEIEMHERMEKEFQKLRMSSFRSTSSLEGGESFRDRADGRINDSQRDEEEYQREKKASREAEAQRLEDEREAEAREADEREAEAREAEAQRLEDEREEEAREAEAQRIEDEREAEAREAEAREAEDQRLEDEREAEAREAEAREAEAREAEEREAEKKAAEKKAAEAREAEAREAEARAAEAREAEAREAEAREAEARAAEAREAEVQRKKKEADAQRMADAQIENEEAEARVAEALEELSRCPSPLNDTPTHDAIFRMDSLEQYIKKRIKKGVAHKNKFNDTKSHIPIKMVTIPEKTDFLRLSSRYMESSDEGSELGDFDNI